VELVAELFRNFMVVTKLANTVFVDTSVLLSALLSTRGASFNLLGNISFNFFINEYVLFEARDVISKKLYRYTNESNLFATIGSVPLHILANPPRKTLKQYEKFVELTDTPIVASARAYTDILITLDKGILSANGKISGLRICTPGDLLVEQRAV